MANLDACVDIYSLSSYTIFSNTKYIQRGDGMNPKYERQLKKGVLEILVLHLLSQQEMYGYQLIMDLDKRSQGMFKLKEGTLYPILYRLEDEGYIESYWVQLEDQHMKRKYYRITQAGRQGIQELEQLWQEFSQTVFNVLGG